MSKNLKIKRKLFKMGVTDRDTGWPPILVTPPKRCISIVKVKKMQINSRKSIFF